MPDSFIKNNRLVLLIIVLLPLILYINTTSNDYALDDSIVITENEYVLKGTKGLKEIFTTETFTGFFKQKKELVEGGRYRPLSLASFAIEYQLWGLKPGISHFINALFYSLLCLILFKTLLLILSLFNINTNQQSIALFSVLLFACHPVHTEVVANIKGRDELLSVLFLLMTLYLALKYFEDGKIGIALLSGIMLFTGLLSKENAIFIWPVLLLLVIFTTLKKDLIKLGILSFFILAGTLGYLLIRISIVGGLASPGSNELLNNPYLLATSGQKLPTIFYTLLVYLKLLFVPHPLTYDYYPNHIALQSWTNGWVILSLLLHVILLSVGIRFFRKNRLISFGVFFYLITLLPMSNLLINIGSFMNERFLFLPSIGFAIIAGFFFAYSDRLSKNLKNTVLLLLTIILILFSVMTINRNSHWKDNLTLFTHDVKVSSKSAKGNCAAGGILYETALKTKNEADKNQMLTQASEYLNTAIEIYPKYIDALLLLGNTYFEMDQNINRASNYYYQIFKLAPQYKRAHLNYSHMLSQTSDPYARKKGYLKLLSLQSNHFESLYQLGSTYGKMLNQLDSAVFYLEKAIDQQPKNKVALRDLGVAHAMQGEFAASLPYFEEVVRLSPHEKDNYINLGITYQKLGELKKANQMFEKAETIQ